MGNLGPPLNADTLLNLGFKDLAVWALSKDGIEYRLDGANAQADQLLLDETNSLYAFVQGELVKYIGKTALTVRERFFGYRYPNQRQRTNWRCNGKIREILEAGAVVRIFVFNPTSHLRYGDFDINLAAGLEDSLITAFKPPWNGSERGRPITEEAEREKEDDVPDQHAVPRGVDELPRAPIVDPAGVASFQIVLGDAYYLHGVINPGVAASSHLGNHDEPTQVNFGDETEPVISKINRNAHKSGVRIVGRNARIAEWFQRHFSQGDVVEARILDRNSILLLPKP